MTEDEYRDKKAGILQWVEFGVVLLIVFGFIYIMKTM